MRLLLAAAALALLAAPACSSAPSAPDSPETASTDEALSASTVLSRAQTWFNARVPYCSAPSGQYDGSICNTTCNRSGAANNPAWASYRTDCSGFVGYVWGLPPSVYTGSFAPYSTQYTSLITINDLKPGDAFNTNDGPDTAGSPYGGHVMLFMGWKVKGQIATVYEESDCGQITLQSTLTIHPVSATAFRKNSDVRIFHPIRLNGITFPAPPPAIKPVRGALDAADCASVRGWAEDENVPGTAIDTDLYFNGAAGDASATRIAAPAGDHRADLCTAIGSCDHGFSLRTPRSLMDGKGHAVHAYGIHAKTGAANAELSNSSKSFNCAPPAIPSGAVKRIVDANGMKGWHFDPFLDVAPYDAAALAIPDGAALDASPTLVKGSGPAVYVLDGAEKRHVASPAVMRAFRFDSGAVKVVADTQLAGYAAGADWPEAPLLAESQGTVYFLDGASPAQSVDADGGAGGDSHAGSAGPTVLPTATADASGPASDVAANQPAVDTAAGDASGCSLSPSGERSSTSGAFAVTLLGVAIAAGRRRRLIAR